jgi:hypothetical protein
MKEKCDQHDKEITEIKNEFNQFKKEVSSKLDELFNELRKPILSDKQIYSLIISLVVYLIFTVNYISGNNYRSIKNENSLEKVNLKNDKIMDILILIKEDVAQIKGSQKVKKNE